MNEVVVGLDLWELQRRQRLGLVHLLRPGVEADSLNGLALSIECLSG